VLNILIVPVHLIVCIVQEYW